MDWKWCKTEVVGLNSGVRLEGSAAFTTSVRGGEVWRWRQGQEG